MEQLVIKSANGYFDEYGKNGIGMGHDKFEVRRQLINEFRREFDGLVKQITESRGPVSDEEANRIIENVAKNQQKKWNKLCKIFACFEETRGLLGTDDLKKNIDNWPVSA